MRNSGRHVHSRIDISAAGSLAIDAGQNTGRRGRNRTCNPRIRNPMLYPFELRARVESTGLTLPDVVETSGLCRFCAMFPLETFRAAVDRAACPRESIAYRRNVASDV